MIYLDYSATTPVNKDVLDTYVKTCENYIGNPNSLHKLGFDASKLINDASKQIKNILGVKKEIIYTSGASEANNLAIFGVCKRYKNRGKHIITTHLEHSSVIECFKVLEKEGFTVDYVDLNNDGTIDLKHLEKIIRNDTILVSICAVNSETGLLQNLDKISEITKKYPKLIFHSDVTQAVGKININYDAPDLISMSAQKFYGMKGVGILLKNNNLEIEPIIYGGKSTTIYRSGTPATPLIVSLAKALRLSYENSLKKYNYVLELSNYTKKELNKIDNVIINSTDKCIPHIINISILNIKPETVLHALEEDDIYISTKTACSNNKDESDAVYELTNDHQLASHSLRVSISYLTTKDEIDKFICILKNKLDKYNI